MHFTKKSRIINHWSWNLMNFILVEGISSRILFKSIRHKNYMFCNGWICLKRITKWNNFSQSSFFSSFCIRSFCCVLNGHETDAWFWIDCHILTTCLWSKTQNLEKKASWSEISAIGHRAFILRSCMEPGLSEQVLVMSFSRDWAGVHGCSVLNYHWGD